MMSEHTQLFENGTGGYRAYPTPTLLSTGSGAILAIREGRNSDPKVMGGDSGDIDLAMRRSLDGLALVRFDLAWLTGGGDTLA